jgi:hypothetical protein
VPGCDKAFAVRSNCKRHLRTHNDSAPSPDSTQRPRSPHNIGFEPPHIARNRDAGDVVPELKLAQLEPTTRMGGDVLDSPSGSEEVDDGPLPQSPQSVAYSSSSRLYDGSHGNYPEQVSFFPVSVGSC